VLSVLSVVLSINVTDRQTDGRLTIAIPRLQYVHRAVKTVKIVIILHQQLSAILISSLINLISEVKLSI